MATSLKINDELKSRVQHLAEIQHRTPHWIMCEAIREYVESKERQAQFKQEALESLAAYQETGRHLTGKEVRAWLNTWGTDQEMSMPKCHN